MKNFAVIVAGGLGKRMGAAHNKTFAKLAGREIILWTLETFVTRKEISSIICVVGDAVEVSTLGDLIKDYQWKAKLSAMIPTGGPARQDGVWSGIQALKDLRPQPDDIVLIHNGANPLVKSSEIEACITATAEFGAAVAAFPVKDTIKRVDKNGIVVETLDRGELWAMQTPQAIKYGIALEAFERAYKEGFVGTDDVQLVERIGGRVKIVPCSTENFKITTPEDLILAERIIEGKG